MNGRRYASPKRAHCRHLRRRLRARLHRPGGRGRPHADDEAFPGRGHGADRVTAWCRASPTRTTCRSSPAPRRRCTASAATILFDVASGSEVMMNDPKWLRAPSILAAARRCRRQRRRRHGQGQAAPAAGSRHERDLLFVGKGRPGDTVAENGIDNVLPLVGMPVPDVYSAELSEFIFAAGVTPARDPAARPACTSRRPTTCSTSTRRAIPRPTASTRCSTATWASWMSSAP